jgi:hypothetical protein
MLDRIDEAGSSHQDASNVPPMETTMQKTAVTVFGALLISGMTIQMAAASEHQHRVTKANFSRHHAADFRGAYNQVRPINVSVTAPALLRTTRTLGDLTHLGLATETRR